MEFTVRDDVDRHRFEIDVDGAPAGFAAYRVEDSAIVITHTQVDGAYRGKGVATELAGRTLDLLRERGQKVVPVCPFFAGYLGDHPEYADLVDA